MWIVVGDIPSSYLPLEDCKSPLEVFETYVDGMTRWTRLARKGQTGTADEGIPPVNVPPTPEWAEKLKSRLQALKEVVRPFFEQEQASSHLSGFHGLCETRDSVMTAQTRKKSPFTLVAFVALLMIAAGSAVYAFLHSGPWIVPEEAKRVVNPLKQSQAILPAARRLYEDKCAECHGDTGKGDGAQGKMYNPQPQDLTDAAHMNAISDGELFYKISEGHRPMPAFRKRLTDEQRWHLVLLIRSFSAATKQQ
jgi:mono/diheme cytochrome c family protein